MTTRATWRGKRSQCKARPGGVCVERVERSDRTLPSAFVSILCLLLRGYSFLASEEAGLLLLGSVKGPEPTPSLSFSLGDDVESTKQGHLHQVHDAQPALLIKPGTLIHHPTDSFQASTYYMSITVLCFASYSEEYDPHERCSQTYNLALEILNQ